MIKRLEPYAKWVYIGTVLVVIAGVCFYLFVLHSLFKEVKAKEEELQSINTDVQDLITELEQQIAPSDSLDLIELAKSIPVAPSVNKVILDIARLEHKTNVSISNISFQIETFGKDSNKRKDNFTTEEGFPKKTLPPMDEKYNGIEELLLSYITFTIDLTGDYASFMNFLKQYNGLPRTIRINEIDFYSKEGKDEADLSATISISVYYIDQFAPFVEKNKIVSSKSLKNP